MEGHRTHYHRTLSGRVRRLFFSILPTSTQYSRNAIFAGLMPRDIEKISGWWLNDNEEGVKFERRRIVGRTGQAMGGRK